MTETIGKTNKIVKFCQDLIKKISVGIQINIVKNGNGYNDALIRILVIRKYEKICAKNFKT